jgi:hypothetical protein
MTIPDLSKDQAPENFILEGMLSDNFNEDALLDDGETIVGVVSKINLSPKPSHWLTRCLSLWGRRCAFLWVRPVPMDGKRLPWERRTYTLPDGSELIDIRTDIPHMILVTGKDAKLLFDEVVCKGDFVGIRFRRVIRTSAVRLVQAILGEDPALPYGAGDGLRLFAEGKRRTPGETADFPLIEMEEVFPGAYKPVGDDLTGDDLTADDPMGDDLTADDLTADDPVGDDLRADIRHEEPDGQGDPIGPPAEARAKLSGRPKRVSKTSTEPNGSSKTQA